MIDTTEFLNLRRQILNREFSRMNDRQRQAVFHADGPLLILAGAGSGKTTVLVNRIANLVRFGKAYGSGEVPVALRDEDMDELRAYQQVWFETSRRRGTDEHPLELEHRKILLDMNHFEELDLEGILLRIGGTVEGYAYGSVLPGGAFDVMVLKGNLDFRFVWRALLRELARYCVDKATYLNLEEDLGLPGLRENKLSYQPCALMEKYQGRLL